MNGLVISPATSLSGGDAERFRSILESSFPPEEREDAEELLVGLAGGEPRCLVARHEGVLCGLAVFRRLPEVAVAYLEYLAVEASLRNLGVGGSLLRAVAALLHTESTCPLGIVFEVETLDGVAGDEADLRARRIGFYLRNGATVVTCAPSYTAPNLAGSGIVAFTLLWIPLAADVPELRSPLLRECVEAILVNGYGLDPSSSLVRENLRNVLC